MKVSLVTWLELTSNPCRGLLIFRNALFACRTSPVLQRLMSDGDNFSAGKVFCRRGRGIDSEPETEAAADFISTVALFIQKKPIKPGINQLCQHSPRKRVGRNPPGNNAANFLMLWTWMPSTYCINTFFACRHLPNDSHPTQSHFTASIPGLSSGNVSVLRDESPFPI